jgi:hypothetical protein
MILDSTVNWNMSSTGNYPTMGMNTICSGDMLSINRFNGRYNNGIGINPKSAFVCEIFHYKPSSRNPPYLVSTIGP